MGLVRGLRSDAVCRWRWYGLVFVAVFAVVVALFGVLRDRQLLFLRTDSAAPTPSAAPGSKLGDETTTTTFLTLRSRAFGRGDCVMYDQTPGRESQTMKVVSCALPHLLEVSGGLDLAGRFDHYPTQAEWGAVLDHDCRPSVEALLGGAIDPTGRFIPSAVFATTEAWARGDHTAWCGVIQAPQSRPPSDGHREPFTGKAEGVPQARLSPIGSCWRNNDAFAVPCDEPHDYEVSGRVDLSRSRRAAAGGRRQRGLEQDRRRRLSTTGEALSRRQTPGQAAIRLDADHRGQLGGGTTHRRMHRRALRSSRPGAGRFATPGTLDAWPTRRASPRKQCRTCRPSTRPRCG